MQTIRSTQPGSTQPGPAEIRARLRAMWASVADGWAEHADYTDRRAADLTRLMLQRTDPQPGERVLESPADPAGLVLPPPSWSDRTVRSWCPTSSRR